MLMSVVLGCHVATATDWNMAVPYYEGGIHNQTHLYFSKTLNEQSKGEINITVFPEEKLFKHKQIIPAVRVGDKAQLGEILGSLFVDRHPAWELDSLPFLADNYEKAEKLWDSSREKIKKDLEKEGLILLYAVPWPGQNFYTKEKLNNINSLSGVKFHVYNNVMKQLAKKVNAKPVEYNDNKLAQGFAEGSLETMMASSITGVDKQMWKFTKYYTKVNAFFPKNLTFISKRVWDKLSEETQQQILASAKKAESYGWALSKTEHNGQELVLIKNGMTSEKVSTSVKQKFFKIGQQFAFDWFKHADPESKKALQDFRGY